jgi:O-antigen/teichoic acid export membrane protein
LATGGALAQAISFGVSIGLARLYAPEDFGAFAIYAFLVTVPSAVICGCYEAAVVLPKDDAEGQSVVALSIVVAAVVALGAGLLIPAAASLGYGLDAAAVVPWLGCVPLQLFALGVNQAFNYWFNRTGNFGVLGTSRIIQSSVTALNQLGAGWFGIGAGGLVLGHVLGQTASSGFLTALALRTRSRGAALALRRSALLNALTQYRRFPMYTSWGTLTSTAAAQIVPVLLARHFGSGEAGLYFFGQRLVAAAVLLGTGSIGQVFYQRAAAEVHAGQKLAHLVETVVVRVAVVAAIPFTIFVAFAPQIFGVVFGPKWTVTGDYMRIVAPLFYLQMITAPVSLALFLLEKHHLAASCQVMLFLGALGSLGAGEWLELSASASLGLYTTVQCAAYLWYLATILRVTATSRRGLWDAIAFRRSLTLRA